MHLTGAVPKASTSMVEAAAPSADAFDGSAEPIIYMSDNRMPVMMEFSSTIIYIIFAALILALIFILPGVRRTKASSFICLLTLLVVGASILLALITPHWLYGSTKINSTPYSSLTADTIAGQLDVNIGLFSANVTLIGKLLGQQDGSNVDYNERFYWDKPDKMTNEHLDALRRGLPYPILSVTEFLSQDADGFNWSRQLRRAGYYCSLVLYMSAVSWCLTAFIMCLVPVYLPHMMQITGALMMSSVWIYTLMIETPKSFKFQLGGQLVDFTFGYTAVTTFAIGAISMFAGVLMFAIQMNNPCDQWTIMESEQVVNDRKGLINIADHSLEKKQELSKSKELLPEHVGSLDQSNDLIIHL